VQSGGYIWVDSEPDKGTAFKICLPLVETEESSPVAPPEPVKPRIGHEKILLVEDEDAVRSVAARVLLNQGYTIVQARHGQEALTLLEDLGETLDLVLTDVVMPDMSGPALAEQLRARWPSLRLLYMSGYAAGDKFPPGAEQAGDSFLQKPFSAEDLVRKVREVLDAVTSQPS
jgi:two-component system, cell cycle sensor histidine kinase and response regulator CckA